MQEPMTSMIASPIAMDMMVPVGPATGRKVEPGMTKEPQPTMQPKAIAQTSSLERSFLLSFVQSCSDIINLLTCSLFISP